MALPIRSINLFTVLPPAPSLDRFAGASAAEGAAGRDGEACIQPDGLLNLSLTDALLLVGVAGAPGVACFEPSTSSISNC